jgi:hypothetical protein
LTAKLFIPPFIGRFCRGEVDEGFVEVEDVIEELGKDEVELEDVGLEEGVDK